MMINSRPLIIKLVIIVSTYSFVFHQTIANLINENLDHYEITGDLYNEKEMIPLHQKENDGTGLFLLYLNKTLIYFLFEQYEDALESSIVCREHSPSMMSTLHYIFFHMLDSLVRLAILSNPNTAKTKNAKKYIKKNKGKQQ